MYFQADDGLDTGDIVQQRAYPIGPNDTIVGLYGDTLAPEGVIGISDAVKAIEDGTADRIVQVGNEYDDSVLKTMGLILMMYLSHQTERDNMEPPYCQF